MRAVVQRVLSASVEIEGDSGPVSIGRGLLILLGVSVTDSAEDCAYMAQKLSSLRLFEDSGGKLNVSMDEVGGEALVVSNFTLYGDCRRGRRPSFTQAASGESAALLYRLFVDELTGLGIRTSCGVFGADMKVSLVNDGPVTLVVESRQHGS